MARPEGGLRRGFREGVFERGCEGVFRRGFREGLPDRLPKGFRKGFRGGFRRRLRRGLPEGFRGGRLWSLDSKWAAEIHRLDRTDRNARDDEGRWIKDLRPGLVGQFGPAERTGRSWPSDRRSTAGMRRASLFFREYRGGVDARRRWRNTPTARPADWTRSALGQTEQGSCGESNVMVGWGWRSSEKALATRNRGGVFAGLEEDGCSGGYL